LTKDDNLKSLMLEQNKRAGVCYALTPDGVELPVIDVTHPAFALNISDHEQRALVEKFLQEKIFLGFLPKPVRDRILKFLLRGSLLAQGIQRAQGSFMSGLNTYLLKLGPEMLGAYATAIDRRIASALPCLSVRLRLQDMASLMVEAVLPLLRAGPASPLRFVNLGAGPPAH